MNTATKLLLLLSRGGSYISTVLNTGPIALWPLSETSGATAVDVAGGYNMTLTNVTVNNATFGDGTPAPFFDGATSSTTLPVATLTSAFTPAAFTIAAWAKVNSAANWTDGVWDTVISVGADANNRYYMGGSNTNNQLRALGLQGGTDASINVTTSNTAWMLVVLTNNTTTNQRTFTLNGTTVTTTAGGTYAGALTNNWTRVGSLPIAGANYAWHGWLKYITLWNRVLTPAEIATLYVPAFAV